MDCLVTKLKAVVNNPDLPILESLNEVTLAAIAASGNSAMNDKQKWALNKFFKTIGAFDDSGIFAKMDYLFLPMICNSNLSKALVNYKDNSVITVGPNIVFSSNGLCVSTGTNANTTLSSSSSRNISNMCVAFCFTEFKGHVDVSDGSIYRNGDSSATYNTIKYLDTYFEVMMSNTAFRTANAQYDICGAVCSRTGVRAGHGFAIGENSNISLSPESTGAESITTPYTTRFSVNGNPIGISMIGAALTTDEDVVLANALRTFVTEYLDLV